MKLLLFFYFFWAGYSLSCWLFNTRASSLYSWWLLVQWVAPLFFMFLPFLHCLSATCLTNLWEVCPGLFSLVFGQYFQVLTDMLYAKMMVFLSILLTSSVSMISLSFVGIAVQVCWDLPGLNSGSRNGESAFACYWLLIAILIVH